MKFEKYCTEGRVVVDDCTKRSFGCEFGCDIGGGLADDVIVTKEESLFGEGIKKVLANLIKSGWRTIGGDECVGYLVRGKGENREFLAPDYNGGFYSK